MKVHTYVGPYCNFSWITNEREVGSLWEITHYCIRQRGHIGNHRCDCDARKERERQTVTPYGRVTG